MIVNPYLYQCTLCHAPTSLPPSYAVVGGDGLTSGRTDFSVINRPVCVDCTQQADFEPGVLRIATQDASQELRDQAVVLRPTRPAGSA